MRGDIANHIGTPHAGAMFTLGEAASGAAMAGAFAADLLSLRPVAAEAQIGYLKVAKGDLVAEARIEGEAEALNAALKADGKVSFPVHVAITDETGAEVTRMTVAWHVSPARR
jgi:acyl-coenzyme A thioesterase PaaI-like protein